MSKRLISLPDAYRVKQGGQVYANHFTCPYPECSKKGFSSETAALNHHNDKHNKPGSAHPQSGPAVHVPPSPPRAVPAPAPIAVQHVRLPPPSHPPPHPRMTLELFGSGYTPAQIAVAFIRGDYRADAALELLNAGRIARDVMGAARESSGSAQLWDAGFASARPQLWFLPPDPAPKPIKPILLVDAFPHYDDFFNRCTVAFCGDGLTPRIASALHRFGAAVDAAFPSHSKPLPTRVLIYDAPQHMLPAGGPISVLHLPIAPSRTVAVTGVVLSSGQGHLRRLSNIHTVIADGDGGHSALYETLFTLWKLDAGRRMFVLVISDRTDDSPSQRVREAVLQQTRMPEYGMTAGDMDGPLSHCHLLQLFQAWCCTDRLQWCDGMGSCTCAPRSCAPDCCHYTSDHEAVTLERDCNDLPTHMLRSKFVDARTSHRGKHLPAAVIGVPTRSQQPIEDALSRLSVTVDATLAAVTELDRLVSRLQPASRGNCLARQHAAAAEAAVPHARFRDRLALVSRAWPQGADGRIVVHEDALVTKLEQVHHPCILHSFAACRRSLPAHLRVNGGGNVELPMLEYADTRVVMRNRCLNWLMRRLTGCVKTDEEPGMRLYRVGKREYILRNLDTVWKMKKLMPPMIDRVHRHHVADIQGSAIRARAAVNAAQVSAMN